MFQLDVVVDNIQRGYIWVQVSPVSNSFSLSNTVPNFKPFGLVLATTTIPPDTSTCALARAHSTTPRKTQHNTRSAHTQTNTNSMHTTQQKHTNTRMSLEDSYFTSNNFMINMYTSLKRMRFQRCGYFVGCLEWLTLLCTHGYGQEWKQKSAQLRQPCLIAYVTRNGNTTFDPPCSFIH